MLRGDRSSHALWAQKWICSFPIAADSIFGSIWCCCRSWQSWLRWFQPYLFPTWRVADSSQFCCYNATNCSELQARWQPAKIHIAQLELSMVLYALHWATWPVSQSSKSLVSGQRGSSDSVSEGAFQQSRPSKARSSDSSSPVCLPRSRPGLLGMRLEQEQLGRRYR